ncbi:hypothetical protein Bca4012_083148 [Brassica carinata]
MSRTREALWKRLKRGRTGRRSCLSVRSGEATPTRGKQHTNQPFQTSRTSDLGSITNQSPLERKIEHSRSSGGPLAAPGEAELSLIDAPEEQGFGRNFLGTRAYSYPSSSSSRKKG